MIRECAKTWVKPANLGDSDGEETSDQEVPFEMVVLDNALNATTTKFNQNFTHMKPIFNKLIDLGLNKPCDTTLEKLLALKKSIMSFETR